MLDFNEWFNQNKYVLEYLYNRLCILSNKYKIHIIDTENTYNNFLEMMYHSSSKQVISRDLFPEYYDVHYHSDGHEKYKVFNI